MPLSSPHRHRGAAPTSARAGRDSARTDGHRCTSSAHLLHQANPTQTCDIACLEALARYDIPSHVLLGGTIPIHSRASHVPHLAEATLARLLRNCIVIGAFAEPATVVDVGGGRGQASMCVADGTTERVRFVVQDLPATAALGRQMLPERYAGRLEFVAHDFFEEQPAREGAGRCSCCGGSCMAGRMSIACGSCGISSRRSVRVTWLSCASI